MLILGIESSCDETAAALVEDGRHVRSNVIASQHDLHREYAGVVPEIASRAHDERILDIIRRALADAGATFDDIDAIAVGHRPGLIGALLVGVSAAKALAWSLDRPLIGVDHVHAHLYAGCLDRDPASYPALGLVVSGGHTSLYTCEGEVTVRRIGSTIDDAVGEAYDKVATILDLPYPGGPLLDALACTPGANDRAYDFPVSRLDKASLDFSFSGLKTAVLYAVRGIPARDGSFPREAGALTDSEKADVAASFQRAASRAILFKLGRALESAGPVKTLLAGGGVTANSRLRTELATFAGERKIELRLPEMTYCVDNAAMIAGLGFHLHRTGRVSGLDLRAVPTSGV